MIVDDDPGVQKLLFDLLSGQYECSRASSGEEALRMLRSEPPGLLICDVGMPGISGLDLIPRIRSMSPDTVVMMISGGHTIDSAIAAIRVGAFDFIQKPFDLDQVEVAVQRGVEHHLLLKGKRAYDQELEKIVEERTTKLNYLAYYDELTGLPNRIRFEKELTNAIADSNGFALVIAAPDNFMEMRDTLGHAISEEILKAFAARLTETLGEEVTIGRLDTAEFGIILPGASDAAVTTHAIEKLFQSLGKIFHFPSHDIFVSVAAGVTRFPDDGGDPKSLIENAGIAMSQARTAGMMSFKFFTAGMREQILQRLVLGNDLRHAAAGEELVVHYQPKIRIGSGEIVGLEALVRWRHPRLGLLYPADFISIAEDTGSIIDIGKWVLSTTCAQVARWHREVPVLHASVNVSPRQFDGQLAAAVDNIIKQTGFDAACLDLEVTESSIMKNPTSAIRAMDRVRTLGVKISIDDFGTGYSSLSQLRSLPVDVLKIDKSFIDGIASDPNDASMVKSIIDLAHSLELKVVAEGVETPEQLGVLTDLGCDEWQGHLYSRALAADEFYELLCHKGPL